MKKTYKALLCGAAAVAACSVAFAAPAPCLEGGATAAVSGRRVGGDAGAGAGPGRAAAGAGEGAGVGASTQTT